MIESQSNCGSTNFIKSNRVSKHIFYKIYAELHIVNIDEIQAVYTCITLYDEIQAVYTCITLYLLL